MPGPTGAPTLVLLHGVTATADLNWFACFAALGRSYRVVALDQRGHGRGIRSPGARFSLEDCADDVAALADVLGIEDIIVVGYSLGGLVAQLVWARHRRLVRGLVLCSTDRGFWGSPIERLAMMAMPGFAAAMQFAPPLFGVEMVGDTLLGRIDDGRLRDWARQEMRRAKLTTVTAAAVAATNFSSRAWIGDIDVPTGVVVTRADQVIPVHRQVRLANSIPGATIHWVEGPHGACVTHPDRFVPVLMEACGSVSSRLDRCG